MLAAGAIGSPQLLQLSGIGPARAAARRTASTSCTTCPASARTCRTTCRSARSTRSQGARTLNTLRRSLVGKAMIGARIRAACAAGPMTMAPSQLGAFRAVDPALRDAQPRVPRAAAVARQVRRAAAPVRRRSPRASATCARPAAATCASRSAGSGDARRASRPNYLVHRRGPARRGRQRCASRAGSWPQPALAPYAPEELLPGAAVRRATPTWRAPPATSARRSSIRSARAGWAATATRRAVVDARLRVHGIDGLRVVDASIMPTITSRQHQRADADDRRARRRVDPERRGVTPGRGILLVRWFERGSR